MLLTHGSNGLNSYCCLVVLGLQVYSLAQQNRFYKKAAGYCLRAVAK